MSSVEELNDRQADKNGKAITNQPRHDNSKKPKYKNPLDWRAYIAGDRKQRKAHHQGGNKNSLAKPSNLYHVILNTAYVRTGYVVAVVVSTMSTAPATTPHSGP